MIAFSLRNTRNPTNKNTVIHPDMKSETDVTDLVGLFLVKNPSIFTVLAAANFKLAG